MAVAQRLCLGTSASISEITLGTMRFADKKLSKSDVAELLSRAFDFGIDTHHSSHEYSSYAVYCDALKELNRSKKNIKHIVKVSSPSFNENEFSKSKLIQLVDNELNALDVECIDVVQWLYRSTPISNEARIKGFSQFENQIADTVEELKSSGKVKAFMSFPYSVEFANLMDKSSFIDGHVNYLNLLEQDYTSSLQKKAYIGIRPYFAGVLTKRNIENPLSNTSELERFMNELNLNADDFESLALNYGLMHKNVASIILGINSLSDLQRTVQLRNQNAAQQFSFDSISQRANLLDRAQFM